MTEKLKTCPFCGGEADIYEPEHRIHGCYPNRKYCVRCPSCGLFFGYEEDYGGYFEIWEEAAEAWNRRVQDE